MYNQNETQQLEICICVKFSVNYKWYLFSNACKNKVDCWVGIGMGSHRETNKAGQQEMVGVWWRGSGCLLVLWCVVEFFENEKMPGFLWNINSDIRACCLNSKEGCFSCAVDKARLIPWEIRLLRRLGLRTGQVQASPGKSITNRKTPGSSLQCRIMVLECLEIE